MEEARRAARAKKAVLRYNRGASSRSSPRLRVLRRSLPAMRASCASPGAGAVCRPPCALSAVLGLPVSSHAPPRRLLPLRTRAPVLSVRAGGDGGAARRVYTSRGQREGRPAPPPARTVSRAPSVSDDAKTRAIKLNQELTWSESVDGMFTLLAPSLAKEPGAVSLDSIHVTAAFTQLSKLQPSGLAGDTRFVTLIYAAEALLDEMSSRTLANLLYALGQLRATLSDSWMAR